MFFALVLIATGLLLTGWGFPASHRLKALPGVIATMAIPAGIVLFLLGTLLLAVPGFFRG
jgi:hypothetical protein